VIENTQTGGFSVTGWVKDIGGDGYGNGRFFSTDLSEYFGFWRGGTVGNLEMSMRQNDTTYISYATSMGTGTWTHGVIVWDHTVPEFRAYVDGELQHTESVGSTGMGTGTDRRFLNLHDGNESTSYNNAQNASAPCGLSDIRLYDRPLDDAEVTRLYQMRNQRNAYL